MVGERERERGREREGQRSKKKKEEKNSREEKQNSTGCSGREEGGEVEQIRSPSFCEHHPPVSYTRFLSELLQTP